MLLSKNSLDLLSTNLLTQLNVTFVPGVDNSSTNGVWTPFKGELGLSQLADVKLK